MDIRLDALLKLRTEQNASLESRRRQALGQRLHDQGLAVALRDEPKCNVMFTPTELITFKRATFRRGVHTDRLITPIIVDGGSKSLSAISTEMKDLAARARDNKLQPHEYQGGTASLSNMGMYGIKHFEAVINPPQGMIMAIGAGEKRPHVVDGALSVATVMSATGSFDHRAIDGADGAALMKCFKELVESPLGMIA
jgi:pyruvate dehydrogenase E2 component (dihydrolipoamide acetyltransferase)